MRLHRTPAEQDLFDQYQVAMAALVAHGETYFLIHEGTPQYEAFLVLNAAVANAERAMVDAGMPINLRGWEL